MSNFTQVHNQPKQPDGRIFASYPMPAKIDLLQERPRRESLLEQQLEHQIGRQEASSSSFNAPPQIQITREVSTTQQQQRWTPNEKQQQQHQQPMTQHEQYNDTDYIGSAPANKPQITREVTTTTTTTRTHDDWPAQQQQQTTWNVQPSNFAPNYSTGFNSEQTTNSANKIVSNRAAALAAELADKEEKLMREIDQLNQRPYSPFQTPAKIDLGNEHRIAQQQTLNAQSPRPYSQASSTRSTSADLQEKEAKLMQEIEEIGRKPYNPQTMVVEREQWYEYPAGNPNQRHLTDARRRVKDFCSLPSNSYDGQEKHFYEENLAPRSLGQQSSPTPGSIHTTIIRSPKREIDNKSPLPFAFDNFTTKGVRGNIASVGAVEPDRPRPPIYPIVKRSPTPTLGARG